MTAGDVHSPSDLQQLLNLVAGELVLVAQLAGNQADLGEELQCLHLEVGVEQGHSHCQRAVVLEQEGVVVLQLLGNRVGNLHGGGGSVGGQWDFTQGDNRFRHGVLVQRNSGNGKAGCCGGMGMYHRTDVGPLLVAAHVHLNLGGRVQLSFQLVALGIDLDDHVRGHKALGNACGGAVELVVAHLNGNVSVVGRHKSVHVDASADLTDFLLNLVGGGHFRSGSFTLNFRDAFCRGCPPEAGRKSLFLQAA